MAEWDLEALCEKWQQRWWDAGLHHAERSDEERPTFWIHFAYPGISGYLHVGHMRGFTYSDVFARYKRQTGHDVLFPAGFHASGIPAIAFAKDVERGEKTDYLLDNGYDAETHGPIETLTDPQKVVEYFAHVYTHDYWKKFGFLIDDRRNCTTIDPGYQRFIQWQFRRLADKGYLTQKPHYAPFCPVAGPVAVDKSETDIKQGGAAEVKEFVAVRFTIPTGDLVDTDDAYDTIVLPCATLRPETLYGVTNLWIDPEHEYELVRVWKDGAVADDDPSEVWLVSQQGRVKLEWQMERAEALDLTVPGKALVGETATAPLTGAEVPVVAASFVDPQIATGIVMSVPGHAPFDYAAYVDAGLLDDLGEPPQILDIKGYDDLPAKVAMQAHGAKTQADAEALEAATEQVYADEFNKGVLNDRCGDWSGQAIKAAKDAIIEAFVGDDVGRIIRQFSEPVVSRAGELVDIKRIPDQDFIHYADPDWTAKAKEHAASMQVFPQRYGDELPNVLDWFGDRACVRRGSWLGTEFPFKQDWIIEPIADSTFYSWYYLVSRYVQVPEGHAGTPVGDADRPLPPEALTDVFFDYVLNGKGDLGEVVQASVVDAEKLGHELDPDAVEAAAKAVRQDVKGWGPVDINLGGKEHQTVHFPVWTMNMVGLMDDPALWPRGIFVNWWVTQKAGAKISKSKGGAEPIPGAAKKYGVDPMRLYYCHVGSPHVDIEWDPDIVLDYRKRVQRIARVTDDLLAVGERQRGEREQRIGAGSAGDDASGAVDGDAGPMDAWLEAAFARHLRSAGEALEAYDLRSAVTELVYSVPDTLRWYQRRGGANGTLLATIVRDWAVALCPLVPHTAEEMFERAGGEGLCSAQPFPQPDAPDEDALAAEAYLQAVLEDVQTVRKLADVEAPETLWLWTAPAWKRDLAAKAAAMAAETDGKFPMAAFMQEVMADPTMRKRGKAVQQFTGRLPQAVVQWSSAQRRFLASGLEEAAVLRDAADFIAEEVGVATVAVHAADEDDAPDGPDPSKRNVASPLKPGIALA